MSANPMEKLIATVNKLQDAFTILGYDPLNLPQICVVGGQSSGKSSVLENIVGRDFLPRGSGIVTRRPLIIQLVYSNVATDYAIFLHKPDTKFEDFGLVRKEIVAVTDLETGSSTGISDKPISVKIFSKNVLNLTMIDLPGITRVPVGDQPKDIEQLIRKMVLKFITPKNAIILAVTAANTDLANSDALQLAREVDPDGLRTIGVITKCDIMDRGTNCLEILEGNVIPLRLGYVAVVNRAQEDIDKNKNIESQWKAEKEYFSNHTAYRAIAERCGTPYLTKTLNRILISHIRTCLPEISAKIATFLTAKREELGTMLEVTDPTDRQHLVLRAVAAFNDQFREMMEGSSDHASSQELFGGARIAYIFNQEFIRRVNKINCLDKVTESEIRTTIRNSIGMRGGLFIPDQSFEIMVKRAIRSLEEPCKECVQHVFEELAAILSGITTPETSRFSTLHIKAQESSRSLLVKCLEPTKELVATLIRMETSRINTSHPAFLGSRTAISGLVADIKKEMASRKLITEQALTTAEPAPLPPVSTASSSIESSQSPAPLNRQPTVNKKPSLPGSSGPPPPPPPSLKKPRATEEPFTEQDTIEVEVIRRLLTSYFDIVRTKIVDSVPKAISLLLVSRVREELHNTLVTDLYRSDNIDSLLDENPESALKRKRTREIVTLLEASQKAIIDVQSSFS